MAVVGGAVAASVVGGAINSRASKKASQAQIEGQREAIDSNEAVADKQIAAQREMFDIQNQLQQQFRDNGLNAQNRLVGMLNGKYAKDFSMNDFQQDPGYAFRLNEGMKAMNANAAARGGLISGNALKAAQKYGQDMGSQEYQNAFNRYQTNRTNQLSPWLSLADKGQMASNNMSSAAGQMGNGISNAYSQMGQGNAQAYGNMGDARASGYVGQANAISGGIGNYLNYRQGQDMVNALRGGTSYGQLTNGWGGGMLSGNSSIGDM
jgi:hypothetical protein